MGFDGHALRLTRNGSTLALGLVQVAIYPTGWTWPHNPGVAALLIGNYLCDMRPMAVGSPAAPTDGC